MNTIILIRGTNVGSQYEMCKRYADEKGYNVLGVVSNVDRVAPLIVNDKIDILLVSHMSRITRKYTEYQNIEYMLRGYGISIEAVIKPKNEMNLKEMLGRG